MATLKALAFLALVSLAAAARMPEASWQHVAEAVEGSIKENGHAFEVRLVSTEDGTQPPIQEWDSIGLHGAVVGSH
jgi:hypothetical protein